MSTDDTNRCGWAMQSEAEREYHDAEWGRPCVDDRRLFEFLVLEAAQAGLSWRTVLLKRENYRRYYHDFDPLAVSQLSEADIAVMLTDAGLIRNRAKIEASISNAKVFLQIQAQEGSFARYLWRWVNFAPLQNRPASMEQIPAQTELSVQISRDLKQRGMRFVGPTIIYAYLQSMGLVNDHIPSCPCCAVCEAEAAQIDWAVI